MTKIGAVAVGRRKLYRKGESPDWVRLSGDSPGDTVDFIFFTQNFEQLPMKNPW